jgi:hypothetical protein
VQGATAYFFVFSFAFSAIFLTATPNPASGDIPYAETHLISSFTL